MSNKIGDAILAGSLVVLYFITVWVIGELFYRGVL